MSEETICEQDRIALTVLFDTVKIEITCASDYQAQVLFDDLAARFEAGQAITIEPLLNAGNDHVAGYDRKR